MQLEVEPHICVIVCCFKSLIFCNMSGMDSIFYFIFCLFMCFMKENWFRIGGSGIDLKSNVVAFMIQ